jgi:hypothetical protein
VFFINCFKSYRCKDDLLATSHFGKAFDLGCISIRKFISPCDLQVESGPTQRLTMCVSVMIYRKSLLHLQPFYIWTSINVKNRTQLRNHIYLSSTGGLVCVWRRVASLFIRLQRKGEGHESMPCCFLYHKRNSEASRLAELWENKLFFFSQSLSFFVIFFSWAAVQWFHFIVT